MKVFLNNIFTKSISAGSVFTVAPFIEPNKHMAFWGEEIMMAARAYTNGFDLVLPDEQYLYHLYYNHKSPVDFNRRKILWNDYPVEFQELDKISKELVYKTLTEGIQGEMFLGTERTLADYGVFAGLDFVTGEIVYTK